MVELRQRVSANRINFLQERNRELWNSDTQSSLPLQPNTQITLSSEEWYTINGVLNQVVKYFTELFEEVESSKLHLPHVAKDYCTVLKEFEDTRKQLEEHSDAQSSTPKCPQIGDTNFQLDTQTSQLFKHFGEI